MKPHRWILTLALLAMLPGIASAFQVPPPYNKRSAFSLFNGEAKAALANKDYAAAIERMGWVLIKVEQDIQANPTKMEFKELKANALFLQAHAYEYMDPQENISAAENNYNRIVNETGDIPPDPTDPSFEKKVVERSRLKLEWKGVDVFYDRLRPRLRELYDKGEIKNEAKLAEVRDIAWKKVEPIDRDANAGLLHVLSYNVDRKQDEILAQVIREFAARAIAETSDEKTLLAIIELLNSKSSETRHGSKSSLEAITQKYKEASKLDRTADEIEKKVLRFKSPKRIQQIDTDPIRDQIVQDVNASRASADKIRRHLPKKFDSPTIINTVEKILKSPVGKEAVEAVMVFLETMGQANPDIRIPDSLSELLVEILNAPIAYGTKHKVELYLNKTDAIATLREQAAKALGSLKVKKAVPDLNKIIEYEPNKEDGKPETERDRTNTEVLRRSVAIALMEISDVRAIPSLVEALDDGDIDVRRAAHKALKEITARPYIDKNTQYDPERDFRKGFEDNLNERKATIDTWLNWWKEEEGIVVLVERYLLFERHWADYNPPILFKKHRYDRDIDRQIGDLNKNNQQDYPAMKEAAEEIFAGFQKGKDFHRKEIMDIGQPAFRHLEKFLSGASDRFLEPLKIYNRVPNAPDPALRLFIAEVIADFIKAFDMKDQLANVRTWAGSGDRNMKIGGLAIMRNLPTSMLTDADFALVDGIVRDAKDAEVSAEAMDVLRAHKRDASIQALTQAIRSNVLEIQLDAMDTLKSILLSKPGKTIDGLDTVTTLTGIIYDPKNSELRKLSAELLGWAKMPDAETREKSLALTKAKRSGKKSDIVNAEREWAVHQQKNPRAKQEIDFMMEVYWALAKARGEEDTDVRNAASRAWKELVKREPKLVADEVTTYFLNATNDELKANRWIGGDIIKMRIVRAGAANAAADTGKANTSAIDALRFAMTPHNKGLDRAADDPLVRRSAAEALGNLKVRRYEVIEDLINTLLDTNDHVRRAAYESLKKVLEMEPHGRNKPILLKNKEGTEVEYNWMGTQEDTRDPKLGIFQGIGKEAFHEEWTRWLKKNAKDFQ